jgi:nucleoside-diphosphate-sugar epimerase
MKKVLLTGATGFIGRHCLPLLLERGYEVHAISFKTPKENQKNIYWHKTNLLDPKESIELIAEIQPSHLLHMAWYVAPGKCWTSLENLNWVQSSISLLQSFAQHGGKRIVMAGTCAEYDWKYGYCSEHTTPVSPDTLYGQSKHALQIILDAFCAQTGLSGAWGRIFFLYGPHEHKDRLVSSVISSLLNNKKAKCSHGNQIRDYLHVEDVADAFVALLESTVQGPINIASGLPITVREIIEKIGDRLNRQDLVELGAIPASTNEAPLVVADVRRLLDEVGWHPKYDLDSGLEQTIEWWKKEITP